MTTKLKYDSVKIELRDKSNPITVESVKELLGWETQPEGKDWEKDFLFRDIEGNKVRLKNNPSNRPFRMNLARRYANEMLRGKWRLNGETWVFDRKGKCQSAQHRGVALVLAEQMRKADPGAAKDAYGWKGPVTIEAVIVYGISERADVVDTLDLGQKRTLGDVLFRSHDFEGVPEKQQQRLANVLAGAIRLTWLRVGGKQVSDAPHFPPSEALDHLADHPGILRSVLFAFDEDGGIGADGKKISSDISLAYAAALHYLMATAKTDPNDYESEGTVNEDLRKKADMFWMDFASGVGLKAGSPILACKAILKRIDSSGAAGRDEICGTIIKSFNLWIDGQDTKKSSDVKVRRTKDKESGKIVLSEIPRLGGLDSERTVEEEPPEADPPVENSEDYSKGLKAGKEWAVNDTAWVKDDDDDPWFGTLKKIHPGDKTGVMQEAGSKKTWEVALNRLSLSKPK